jgi:hypothetical protein
MQFAPPPPDLRTSGELPAVVDRLLAHLDAERRAVAWEAPDLALSLTDDGRLSSGPQYDPVPFEASGFRALVGRYRCFYKATDLLERLPPDMTARVWSELYDPSEVYSKKNVSGKVLVAERGATPAVFAVYPAGYPADYNVGHVAASVQGALAGAPLHASLEYNAAGAALRLRVVLPRYALVVTACDLYGEPAPRVEVVLPDGTVLGQPPTQERRRRPGTGGETTAAGIVEKVHAAPAFYAAHAAR